ncbi:MAG: 5-formyltetrahydrofolate cyclo-ligase [Oscillospiraceae bacterium]|nr:5-formyltetrahydrofolate cyclo-ligase [Oscillospiraceae bacterium]
MDKKAFRKEVFEKIAALPEEYIVSSNSGIYENFIALSEFASAKNIFAYISEKREPDTVRIIEKALELGKTVALPVSFDGGIMVPKVIKSLDELEVGKFGIPAPKEDAPVLKEEDIDLIIVPAVTFDRNGYRLGRGGGYYDRFLERSAACSVGLGREKLLCEVPLEKHDMPVKYLVTESKVYK